MSRIAALALGLVAVNLLALASTPTAAATCRGRNFVDGLNLIQVGTTTLRVTSRNGNSYDQIERVSLTGDIRVDLCGDGAIDAMIVHFGSCSGHQSLGCAFNPVMHLEFPSARDLHVLREFSAFSIPPDSPTGLSILEKCNAVADRQRGAASARAVSSEFFFVTLGVDTRRDIGRLGGDGGTAGFDPIAHGIVEPHNFRPLEQYSKTKPAQFKVDVECAPLPEPIKAPPKITDAALGVTTSGDTCPKPATADVLIAAPEPRAVFYKIERGNGTTTTPDWIEGRIKKQKGLMGAESVFLRAEHKLPALDPGNRKFRLWIDGWGKTPWREVKVECPPFKVISAWLNYDVEDKPTCPKDVAEEAAFKSTRPGKAPFEIKTQGGLVVHSGTAAFERQGNSYAAKVKRKLVMNAFDQDMMALIKNQPDANSGWTRLRVECMEVVSGTLDLREFAATRCEGEAALSIHTNMPGEVPYQLDCTGDRSWSGTTQAHETGPNTYLGVDVKRFDVANNEQVNCALKTRAPFPVKVLALKGNKYECHKPSGASGTSDLTSPSRPDDPPPVRDALKGDFTFVDTGGTQCPRKGWAIINFLTDSQANVHYSLDCTHGSFSGVAQVVKGPKGGFIAPASVSFDIAKTTQANCALKSVAPGKPEVHTLKGHLFQCVKTAVVPGASDLKPPSRPDTGAPAKPGKVVVDPPRIPPSTPQPKVSCAQGKVQYGKCACERGFHPVAVAANAFRCVRTATLPPVKTPVPARTTPTAQPKVGCYKGSVRNGQCLCPSGTVKQTIGPNAFRCAQITKLQLTPPPTKGCPLGQKRVKGRCIRPAG